jgi:hypothetical protein
MAVATINSIISDMVLVAELDRLCAGDPGLGDIRRAIDGGDYPTHTQEEKNGDQDTDFGNRIGARMKNLCHLGGG